MSSQEPLRRLLAAETGMVHEAALEALEPLSSYDKRHNGDLLQTLRVYLKSGCNASRSAELLYLHRSGLLYRLRRIEELLGIRLDTFEDRVALEIAVLAIEG